MSSSLDLTDATMSSFVVHKVGSKLRQEGVLTSRSVIALSRKESASILNFLLRDSEGAPYANGSTVRV